LAKETEVLGEDLPQRHFVRHKSYMIDPALNPGRRGGKPATNRLRYGADHSTSFSITIITRGWQNRPFFNLCGGTLGTAATTGLLYQPRMIGDGDCGEIRGMNIGKGNRSTRRKPTPAPLCPPQILHDRPASEPGPPRWEASD
jgi:hypothetical protein